MADPITDEKARATCGRCGAYRDLHPTRWCEKSRHSFWWDEHYAPVVLAPYHDRLIPVFPEWLDSLRLPPGSSSGGDLG
jgi:hypothetical protein